MIKNVIFDWSGVINDNLPLIHATATEFFTSSNLPALAFEQFQNEICEDHMNFYYKYFPHLNEQQIIEWYTNTYRKVSEILKPRVYPGMAELVKKLQQSGIRQIILSSDNLEHLQKELNEYGLNDVFQEINHTVQNKSKGIEQTLQRNNFTKEESIIIGDTGNEIRAGKSAGILTGAVTWGMGPREFLKKQQPDYIFNSPADISDLFFA